MDRVAAFVVIAALVIALIALLVWWYVSDRHAEHRDR